MEKGELFWYHCQGQSGSCSVIRGRGAITARAEMAGREDVTVGWTRVPIGTQPHTIGSEHVTGIDLALQPQNHI
jgi:hypothetical protein